jgi:hypothetical protein
MNMGIEFLEDKITPVDSLLLNKRESFRTPIDTPSFHTPIDSSSSSSSSKYYTPEGSPKDITV